MHALGAEIWKWVALACGTVTAGTLVFVLVGSSRGLFFVGWGRYLDLLTRRLRRLHIFKPASSIASTQLALIFLILLAVTIDVDMVPYWYGFVLAVAVLPALTLERRARERVAKLDVQADAFCLALANALKSTASVAAALETASALIDEPTKQEMQLAVKETKVGRSLPEALEAVGPRAGSRKLGIVLAAVLIGRQVGGDLPRVLDTTAATLREMERLEGVVRQKTAEGRMQMWALSFAPIAICGAVYELDPKYFEPLTETFVGQLVTGIAMAIYAIGIAVAQKVLRVNI